MSLSFDNTQIAFAYKSTKELGKAKFLFSTMNYPFFVPLGTRITPFLMKTGLPVDGIIRNTIFRQFVGGETLTETALLVKMLGVYGVKVILDFVLEGSEGEDNFEKSTEEFVKVIE